MPRHIPKNFINDLLVRIDIVEIIGNRIKLRKAGANFTALCPFHNEKTPSFTVSPTKQFYHCFGCGAHGNAISFLMDFDHLEFVEAIESLAAQIGLEVPKEQNPDNKNSLQLEKQRDLLKKVNKYYQQQLRFSEKAINYLKSRQLSGKICKRFNIGYAPKEWDNLLAVIGSSETERSSLIATGMLIKKDNKLYDRFRDRIMFPIKNNRGQIIGFGGRAITNNNEPKYLNSPETALYHKSNELYGLHEILQTNKNIPYILIVEGYMDVIALTQYGISLAVATLGTATTAQHIQKLYRHTSKIIFCFDGDTAGKTAAWRALENAIPTLRDDVQIAFLFLPEGEDPDNHIRKHGKDFFLQQIDNALPLSDFIFNHFSEHVNLNTMSGRAQMAQKANNLLSKIPNGIFKQLMYKQLADIVHLDETEIRTLKPQKYNNTVSHTNQMPSLTKTAIKLLLHYPELAECIDEPQQISSLNIAHAKLLEQILFLIKNQSNITSGGILEHWRNHNEIKLLADLLTKPPEIPFQHLKSEFIATIQRLYEQGREYTIQELLEKINNGNISEKDKYNLQNLIIDAKIKIMN